MKERVSKDRVKPMTIIINWNIKRLNSIGVRGNGVWLIKVTRYCYFATSKVVINLELMVES
jgi:hypothetical protein